MKENNNRFFGGNLGKTIVIAVIVFVAGIMFFDVSYQVKEQEQAVLITLGSRDFISSFLSSNRYGK